MLQLFAVCLQLAYTFPQQWFLPEKWWIRSCTGIVLKAHRVWFLIPTYVEWLKHFAKFVKPSESDPVLLLLDNHVSHCSLDAVLYCRENFITLFSLPPHASQMTKVSLDLSSQPIHRTVISGWSTTQDELSLKGIFVPFSTLHTKESLLWRRRRIPSRLRGFTRSILTSSATRISSLLS